MTEEESEAAIYGDNEVKSYEHKPVPLWLKVTYVVTIVYAIVTLYLYWGGSWGWLDRGYWYELQKAAKTTFPLEKSEAPDPARNSPYIQPLR